MIKLYDHPESGNCYKVRLLLTQLEIPFETQEFSVTGDRDAQRGAGFFTKNPIGKIPTVELEDGTVLGESMAILWWFAEGTAFLPEDRLQRARVLQWMAFEQNNHEPNIATARHQLTMHDHRPPASVVEIWKAGGERALRVMNAHLEQHEFLVDRYSIADIALFAYTHVAEEGGVFRLADYPGVERWLESVRSTPNFIPMR